MERHKKTAPLAATSRHGEHPCGGYSNCNPIDLLLPRLNRVKATSGDSWLASCPGPLHENGDKHPSLSIKQTADGTVLMHCYAGCQTSEVLSAIGLTVGDLFPASNKPQAPLNSRQRKRYGQALAALRALELETMIICVAAERVLAGDPIDREEMNRTLIARERILNALEVAA